ncbi:MAG: TolC family protein [Myxococcota bacterium]|nr:TolC family protein [Myxococcota bacterium]
MTRRTLSLRSSIVFGVLLAAVSPVAAEEHTVSLAEVRSRAAARSPDVRQAMLRIREAEATRVGAGIIMPVNPRVQFDLRPGLNQGTGGTYGYGTMLDLLFEVSGAGGARVREADMRAAVARAQSALTTLEARLAATEAYVATALARKQLKYARDGLAIAERLTAVARERMAVGAGSEVELSTALAELAERRADVHAAESSEALQQMGLRLLADLSVDGPLQLASPVDMLSAPPEASALAEKARRTRPDLALIDARVALLHAADERLRKEAAPRVGFYGGLDAAPASPTFGFAGLSVELPVAQRNQGPRAVAAAETRTELEVAEMLLRRIDVELLHRRTAHEAARTELAVLADEGIPVAERRLALVEEGWRSGRFDVFKVQAAAENVVRLKALRLDVLQRLWRERLALERLVGGFPDEEA